MEFSQYSNETKYGAKIGAPSLSIGQQYVTIALGTTGATAVNVFSTSTAPIAGTVTGYFTTAGATTGGTFTLWGTTAGTIATIFSGTTVGLCTGTTVLAAAIAKGDTVTVTGITTGTATAFVTFQSAS